MLSQDITLNCQFVVSFGDYGCILSEITVLDPTQTVIIGGQHVGNRTNDDVNVVLIYSSNTPFIIPEIFSTFPNTVELEIDFCNLQSIKIPDTVRLEWLDVFGNDIERIDSDAFTNQTSLAYLFLTLNGIQEIDENAFEGLSDLLILQFAINDVEQLEPRTFRPLPNLLVLDLEANFLRSIGDIFSENRNLQNLYLEYNGIEEIHPRFNVNLRNSLQVTYLYLNVCVNRGFYLDSEVEWGIMNSFLRSCFLNFNRTTSDEKDYGMEIHGPLRIYDEFENLIGSV